MKYQIVSPVKALNTFDDVKIGQAFMANGMNKYLKISEHYGFNMESNKVVYFGYLESVTQIFRNPEILLKD